MSERLRASEISERVCLHCRMPFMPRKGSKGLYCSAGCARFGIARTSAAQRGDLQRGRGEGKTYRKRNGRHEHRIVAEQKLGRSLDRGEIVHHIDGNKRNNDPDNLAVMTQGAHMREHGMGIPGVRPAWQPWLARRSK